MRDDIAEIDGARGIAIGIVMIHRLWPRDALTGSGQLAELGWIGVDLFFVISGFLITRILLATREDPDYFKNFYARRVLRIFPLYYAFIGLLLVFGSPGFHAQAGDSGWYLGFLGNVPEGVLGLDPPYWLAPVWSLAIEEQFYLTFPLLVRRLEPRVLAKVLIGLFLLAPAVRLVTMLEWPDRERIQYMLTPCRFDAIAAGCFLAVLARSARFVELRRVFAGIGLAMLAVGAASGLDRTSDFGRLAGYSVVALGFAGAVGWIVCARGERLTAFLRVGALRYLGRLCFGLYLLHRPADTLTNELAARFGLDASVGVAWVPVKIAVAVVLATVSWRLLEVRFWRLKRRFVPAVATIALAACSGTVEPGGGGYVGVGGDVHAEGPRPLTGRGQVGPGSASGPHGRVLYATDLRHSPITIEVARGLQTIAARAPALSDDVFAKVGDSITEMPAFATCFDGSSYDLAAHAELEATRAYFDAADAAGASSWARTSAAATGGWTSSDLVAGDPSPLDQEVSAIAPRAAVVLIGTNDDRTGGALATYAANVWTIVDRLEADGVVPLVSTIPPMHSDPDSDARVPVFNLLARAVAQGRQVPLVDFYRELAPLPNEGIGSDGLHPTTSPDGACSLTAADLQYGFDVRNLVTLEQLARLRSALAGSAPDASAPERTGSGSTASPFSTGLPVTDIADTRTGDAAFAFSGCGPASAGGHQVTYTLSLAAPTTLDLYAYTHVGGAAAIHVLAGTPSASACIAGGTGTLTVSAPAGTLYLVVSPADGSDCEVLVAAQPH